MASQSRRQIPQIVLPARRIANREWRFDPARGRDGCSDISLGGAGALMARRSLATGPCTRDRELFGRIHRGGVI